MWKPPAHSYSECGQVGPGKDMKWGQSEEWLTDDIFIPIKFETNCEGGILTWAKSWHCSLKTSIKQKLIPEMNLFVELVGRLKGKTLNWLVSSWWDCLIIAWERDIRSWTRTQQKQADEALQRVQTPSGSDPSLFRICSQVQDWILVCSRLLVRLK